MGWRNVKSTEEFAPSVSPPPPPSTTFTMANEEDVYRDAQMKEELKKCARVCVHVRARDVVDSTSDRTLLYIFKNLYIVSAFLCSFAASLNSPLHLNLLLCC